MHHTMDRAGVERVAVCCCPAGCGACWHDDTAKQGVRHGVHRQVPAHTQCTRRQQHTATLSSCSLLGSDDRSGLFCTCAVLLLLVTHSSARMRTDSSSSPQPANICAPAMPSMCGVVNRSNRDRGLLLLTLLLTLVVLWACMACCVSACRGDRGVGAAACC